MTCRLGFLCVCLVLFLMAMMDLIKIQKYEGEPAFLCLCFFLSPPPLYTLTLTCIKHKVAALVGTS